MNTIKRALHKILYAGGITRAWLMARAGSPIILMYHGVTNTVSHGLRNCEGKHVPRDLFIEQMRFIGKYRKVIGVTEMAEGIRCGDDLPNTVAITFDDGYENNHTHAAEILSDFGMPATFFLSTGYIGVNRWMWTDRVEYMLDRTDRDVVALSGIPGTLALATLPQKKLSFGIIKAHLKQQPGDFCEPFVRELEHELGLKETDPIDDYRFMSWEQVRKVAAAGFEIGAHTVNHPILSRIAHADAINEILISRDKIRTELDRCSDVFCYPNGKSTDYTDGIKEVCRLHFRAALSTNRGPAKLRDLYELNRIGIGGTVAMPQLAWTLGRER